MIKWQVYSLLALLGLLTAGALAEAGDSAVGYPLTVTDSAGREVTLQMPVERIIVLNSDAAEAVTMLGAADKIVGVVDTIQKKTDFFPDLKSRQSVGKWNDINYEMLGEIAKKGDSIPPDILVISYTYPDKPYGVAAVEKGLAPFKGINVVGLDFYKPETAEEEITKLGAILGKEDKAREYLDWRNQKLSQVEDAVDGLVMPKVYFEMNSKGGLGALSTYGKGSGLNDLQRKAGGYNIAKDLEESSPKVDWE